VSGRRSPSATIWRSAMLVLLALLVVGATMGTAPSQHPARLAHRALLDQAARLALSGLIALLVVVAGVLVATLLGRDLLRRRTLLASSSDDIPRWQRVLTSLAALLLVGGLGYLVIILGHRVTPHAPPPPAAGTGQARFLAKARATPTHFALLPPVAVGLGILVLLGAWLLLARRHHREELRHISTTGPAAGDAPAPLDLDALRALEDPRLQVQLAWQAAETALAQVGLPRHPAESASEYLRRLRDLAAAPSELDPLLVLFLGAKYSAHAPDAHDATVAIDLAELILARTERASVGS
jgi:TRAP-type C4-dicarboxylate transport system permease small subunit